MALGNATFTDIGGAVSDLYSMKGHQLKAQGQRLEAGNYDQAAIFAEQNAQFTEQSTAIKTSQQEREALKVIGGQQAEVAGSGFASSGSALDLMRDSSSQAALSHALIQEQGKITEQGYEVQATSYRNLAAAGRLAADAEDNAAEGSMWSSVIKGAAAIGTLFV